MVIKINTERGLGKIVITLKETFSFPEEVVNFRNTNITHLSAKEFLSNIGDDIKNYQQIHLSTPYVTKSTDHIYLTEFALIEEAIKQNCRYASDINYLEKLIVAIGLIPKS